MGERELPVVDADTRLPLFSRPLLLAVAPEPAMARALEHDLRRAFAPRGFEALSVDSGATALELLETLRRQSHQVALLIADQELPDLSGIELVVRARALFGDLRTIVLTPHAQMPAAVEAIDQGSLDYFFIKPLRPAEEQLAPLVADLLEDWERWTKEDTLAVRIVAHPSQETHELREFLAHNDIHHQFLDIEHDDDARLLLDSPRVDPDRIPLVVLGDGRRLERPTLLDLAEGLGLPTRPQRDAYDLVVVGGGPAGLAAAVYGASEGLETLLLERRAPGGQAGQSSRIENYLGFPGGLTGSDLAQRALRQARRFGAEVVRLQDAAGLEPDGQRRVVTLADDTRLECRTALVCCGVSYRRLDAPGIADLMGVGVYYGGAASEAQGAGGRDVFVVGGANSAGQAAMHFSRYARRVTMLVRADAPTMSSYLLERVDATDNVEVRTNTTVAAASGDGRLESLTLADAAGATEEVAASSLFIFIGAVPHTEWLRGSVLCDPRGFVLSGRDVPRYDGPGGWGLQRDPYPLETNVPGVFTAGDVRHGSVKRVASAVGEGSMAVQLMHEYLGP